MKNNDKYYINIGKATDIKDLKQRKIYRYFEILPGFLAWTTLFSAIIFSLFFPSFVAYFIIIFCLYWLFRAIYFSFCLCSSYKEMRKNLNTDWNEKLKLIPESKNIFHLIIFPMYKEDIVVARESFQALLKTQYPKEKMIVVLGIEERAGKTAKEIAEKIKSEFGDRFYKFLITTHPKDIQGELAGKGSNETWAIKQAKEKIIDVENISYNDIIVSCLDIDTQVFPQYFSILVYQWFNCSCPYLTSFQPIPLYLNNISEAPFFSRVVSSCNVFWQMIQQQRPEKIVTYSSHSMSFKALNEMNFWQTNVVSEDAGVFWKAFLFYNGDYQIFPLHYPVSMDSCLSKNLKDTIISQYKQQRRWAWGSEGIPYLLFGFLKNKKIPFIKKFHYAFLLVEGCWAWATNALLILFLGWLPIMLGGSVFRETMLSYSLPSITGNIMKITLIGIVVFVIINTLLLGSRNFYFSKSENFFILTQWIFLPISLIIFGALPALDAQTRLMLGKYMGFSVTEKVRKKIAKN
ncbi:MAG: glycosyltransferase family 2 protein [Patescibacteria group bacterium]|nr:glycosyltransferase family 2 protein [Patescibacteria group bacterium]